MELKQNKLINIYINIGHIIQSDSNTTQNE